MNCIFCKFASKEIPKEFTYEDDAIMVFPDIKPNKPIHLLIVPKKHMTDFQALSDDVLWGKLRKVIQKMVVEQNLETTGFRLTINGGGAQAIDHLHIHLTGPMGKSADM